MFSGVEIMGMRLLVGYYLKLKVFMGFGRFLAYGACDYIFNFCA